MEERKWRHPAEVVNLIITVPQAARRNTAVIADRWHSIVTSINMTEKEESGSDREPRKTQIVTNGWRRKNEEMENELRWTRMWRHGRGRVRDFRSVVVSKPQQLRDT